MICGLALTLVLGTGLQARAHSAQQILMPFYTQVDTLQRALKELNHQTEHYRLSLLAQHRYLVRCRNQGLNFAKSRVVENLRRRSEVNGLMKSGYDRLLVQDGKAWVPLYGWLDKNARNTRYKNEKAAIDAEQEKIRRKTHPFFVPTLGWITEDALDKRIQQADAKARDVLPIKNRGDDRLFYPGLGWNTRKVIKDRLQKVQTQITQITGQINRGEYRVWLPHLGYITRKQVQSRIADVDRQIKDIKGKFARKEAPIQRQFTGAINQKALEARIAQNRQNNKKLHDAINAGTYKAQMPTLGMADRKQIKAKHLEMQGKWQTQDQAWKTGKYAAPVKGFGMMNRKQIEAKLRQKGLTGVQKQNLQSGRLRIDNAFQIETKMRQAYIRLLYGYGEKVSSAAIPEQELINYNYEFMDQIKRRGFNTDRMANIRQLLAQRELLQQSLALIPSKVPPRPK